MDLKKTIISKRNIPNGLYLHCLQITRKHLRSKQIIKKFYFSMKESFMPKLRKDKKEQFNQLLTKLENMILIGMFQPRERLVELDLAKKLSVQRNWIRDALKILESRGLIKIAHYKGAIVSELDEKEIQEIFQVRVVLERLAYSLACENFEPSDGVALRDIADRIKDSYKANNYEEMIAANSEFHNYIVNLSKNETLGQMINQLRIRFHIFNSFSWSSPEIVKKLEKEHYQFIEALESKDLKKLNNLSESHFSYSKDMYLNQLRARKVSLSNLSR